MYMPKTTAESEYIKYMSSLQSKIRAEEVGLQSWKGGKRVQIAPIKMSVNDTLLAGDKLNKLQKSQNQMVEEYLEKQKGPIKRYDEFGNVIGEYKYHEIPPPELEDVTVILPPVTRTRTDRDGNEYEEEIESGGPITIPVQDVDEVKTMMFNKFSRDLETINREIEESKRDIEINEEELLDTNDDIIETRQERERVLAEIQTQYDTELDIISKQKNRKRKEKGLITVTNERRRIFLEENTIKLNQLKAYAEFNRRQIKQFKDQITELQLQKNDNAKRYETVTSEIDKVSSTNKQKLNEYQQQLQKMNTGPFGLDQNVDETDIEYAERLQAIANEEFPSARTEEKANQLNKEELREKLTTLFRDRSLIDGIVNSLDLEKGVYLLNSQFPGFKLFFEKRYGEFNKNVKLQDVMYEIERYFKEQTPQEVIKKQYEEALIANPRFKQPSLSSSTKLADPIPPIYSSSSSFGLEPSEIYEGSAESKQYEYEEDPETGLIPPSSFEPTFYEPATIIPEPLPSADDVKLLRFINPSQDGNPPRIAYLKIALVKKKNGPEVEVPFISPTGKKGSFREVNYGLSNENGLKPVLSQILGTSNFIGYDESKGGLKKLISDIGLQRDNGYLEKTTDSKGRIIMKGLGLKMSDNLENIPTIINFGLVFLLLRKLYLNNILSIQNKHYKKVNGFNNVKVSDTFVEIIQDILNEKNYISKLSQLSNNEREIFDHLLYIAGLHKQLNGGAVADADKLKKQLEILEGEILAGNNNILLKKKLFNLLQKMSHYKMISAQSAQQHYKQFDQYFK